MPRNETTRTAPRGHDDRVVTWQTASGDTRSICRPCERMLRSDWPKNARGEEYAQVSMGEHRGRCYYETAAPVEEG